MKAKLHDSKGNFSRDLELPKCFNSEIREDLVWKVLESLKRKQPYSPSLVAGKQHSADGILRHRRHVWKTHYGMGISRIPRKIMSRRGSRFNWVGAEVAGAVGGRRAHPPKVAGMISLKKINKKEHLLAMLSSLSSTANPEIISKKYSTLNESFEAPFIIDSFSPKAKENLLALKSILGNLFSLAIQKKSIRAGKGKLRGRKYKKSAGALIVIGKDEELKLAGFDIVKTNLLNVEDLAKGGLGRITIYTEKAIKELGEKYK